MKPANKQHLRLPASVDGSRWIVGTIALLSLGCFTALGSKVIPAALGMVPGVSAQHVPTIPFLLCIALIALAWRRSVELNQSAFARIAAQERAHDLAYRDDVTGLSNRRYLVEALRASDASEPHALLLLDMDHFKKINDLYGHAAGDLLLVTMADRMKAVAPEGACCVRLGGDEFAIFASGTSASYEAATLLAETLQAELNRPIELEASVARIGASMGLASLMPGEGPAESLLRRSDMAMYEAKHAGRNCYVWFDAAMEERLNARNQLEADMRDGLTAGQFIPYFQPMLELASMEVKGFEVLARWNHPAKGILEADEFIPVAEATGMISELSFAVMRAALVRALTWPKEIVVAVNISPIQFKDPHLAHRIVKVLTETGFPAGRLELELTESAIIEDRELTLATVQSLKNYGVRISLDDFGTRYASLSQLRDLPFDRIKIDRSFVASFLHDEQSNAIVHAIASLGKSLHLPITAEGVESESVRLRLHELGCSDAQGWLFGRAMPGDTAGETYFDRTDEASIEGVSAIARPHQRTHLRRAAQ